jgi:MFS family permease
LAVLAQAPRRSPWWIVVGSVLCLMVGNGPVMQFTFGVFIKPVAAATGAGRGGVSLALLVGLCLTGVATPVAGRLIDRYGIRRVTLPSIVLCAGCVAALGLLTGSLAGFVGLYGLLGIASAGQTPMPYARAVAGAFGPRRGLALGVAMAGVGLGTILLPQLAQRLIAAVGWRGAYEALGAVVLMVALPAAGLLVTRPAAAAPPGDAGLRDTGLGALAPGRGIGGETPDRVFFLMAGSFFLVAMAVCGVTAHLAPLLTDRGISPGAAAGALSIAGAALIGGRLLAGVLLDRWFAPRVALGFFAAPLAGIGLLLTTHAPGAAYAAAVLAGLGLGGEVDLIAYLLSRYFGLRAFGELYGYLFAVFTLGSGLGPYLMGAAFARTGSYDAALVGFGLGLVVACGLISCLGGYRFAVDASPAARAHRAVQ